MNKKIVNPELIKAIAVLKKKSNETGAAIWRDLAKRLSKTKHKRTRVNVSQIKRYSNNGDTIAVPGKILGAGVIDHPVYVAAFSFSKQAKHKILEANGECLTLYELAERNPKGSNVKIMS